MSTNPSSNDTTDVLHVKVGETLVEAGRRAADAMRGLELGQAVQPYFGVSFTEVGQMLAAFTPRRWELIAALREAGPITVAELARRLGRNYKNVHTDVAQLMAWMAVERADDGRVHVPWSEIIVDMKLPRHLAA
jgi:predicted transcriptional regulator